jgi:polyhydroxybutyrate depolymerase
MAFFTLVIAALIGAETLNPGDHNRKLTVDGRERNFLVHIPPKYDPKKPTPVILAFHGGGANASNMVAFSNLNDKSDKSGFIVVYPNGSGRQEKILSFNGGNCCAYAMNNKIDDVEFTRRILDNLAKSANIDPKRIYATGISNGGIMCYLLASELSERIAAIAPVGGPMGTSNCNPKRPVSVIHFHGTDDEFAPFKGGKGKGFTGTEFYSVDHSIQAWIKANGCNKAPSILNIPDNSKDGTTITRKTFGSGKDNSEVVLIEIQGGGHTWPGQEPRLKSLGKSTKNISANDLMWEFFQKHPIR